MSGSGTMKRQMRLAALALLAICLSGCAAGPIGGRAPMRGPRPMDGPGGEDLPPPSLVLVHATIVDVNASRGTLTVKDDQSHGTWTVAVTAETRILGTGRAILALSDLQVGQRVQIRGYSRIEELLTALEVEQELESQ